MLRVIALCEVIVLRSNRTTFCFLAQKRNIQNGNEMDIFEKTDIENEKLVKHTFKCGFFRFYFGNV